MRGLSDVPRFVALPIGTPPNTLNYARDISLAEPMLGQLEKPGFITLLKIRYDATKQASECSDHIEK